jgi:serine/threonine protein phosphatase PrpC
VVETLRRALTRGSTGAPEHAWMEAAVQTAHKAVRQAAEKENKKMGATLTAAFVRAGVAYIAEVGDSRAYLLRAGVLTLVTHDQSLVQSLIDHGAIDAEEAAQSPHRGVILQAMGQERDVKVAMVKLELRDRDCLLLCSDGLTGLVSDAEIQQTILASGRPEVAARQLLDMANERGGTDNITVVVAGIGGELEPVAIDEPVEKTLEVLAHFDDRVVAS